MQPCDLPQGWNIVNTTTNLLVISRVQYLECRKCVIVKFSVIIEEDSTWTVILPQGLVIPHNSLAFEGIPSKIDTPSEVIKLLGTIDAAKICCGNSIDKYRDLVKSRKGAFMNSKGGVNILNNNYAIFIGYQPQVIK